MSELVDQVYRESEAIADVSPYQQSVFGEYSRLLLLCLVFPLVFWFGKFYFEHGIGLIRLIESTILFSFLLFPNFAHRPVRFVILTGMLINVGAVLINPNRVFGGEVERIPEGSLYAFAGLTAVSAGFEFFALVQSSRRSGLIKAMGWSLLALPALVYIVGLPIVEQTLWADESKAATRDPNWNITNEISFRAAKFVVFATFTYLGACLGSFLNVVAHSLPRGESVGLRDSSCPKCGEKIKRMDNLPLFSYVNLGGRCRNCKTDISIRYLLVEMVAALIFGSLFLYELVAGCVNVPFTNVFHRGILWIILYPKWPAIGMYFYHAFFMSSVLLLALIEWDSLGLKLRYAVFLVVAFFVSALCLPGIATCSGQRRAGCCFSGEWVTSTVPETLDWGSGWMHARRRDLSCDCRRVSNNDHPEFSFGRDGFGVARVSSNLLDICRVFLSWMAGFSTATNSGKCGGCFSCFSYVAPPVLEFDRGILVIRVFFSKNICSVKNEMKVKRSGQSSIESMFAVILLGVLLGVACPAVALGKEAAERKQRLVEMMENGENAHRYDDGIMEAGF